jgi:hypothetical protein
VGRFARRRRQRQINDLLHRTGRERRLAGLARLIAQQTRHGHGHEARLPCPHHRLRPDRRMISVVPQPSAVARMILARQTCFCGALRSATIDGDRYA